MKTLMIYLSVVSLLLSSACTPEIAQPEELQEPIRPKILKSIEVQDHNSSAYLELQIANPDLLYLTADDIEISAEQLSGSLIAEIQVEPTSTVDETNEGKWEDADFYIDDMELPLDANALNIKITFPVSEVGERGCKDPLTFEANGKCRLAEPGVWGRTKGFYAKPRNCNHTDWEWKRKRWWGYKKLYDRDSYSSSSNIGYTSSVKYDAYQLRIDPNNSCCYTPGIVDFNFVYGYSYNDKCE